MLIEKIMLIGLHEQSNGDSVVYNPTDAQITGENERNLLPLVAEFPKYDVSYYRKEYFHMKSVLENIHKQL